MDGPDWRIESTGGSLDEQIRDENRRIRHLRLIVDLTSLTLIQGGLSRKEGEHLVQCTRGTVLKLFPGKEEVYDLIYKPRFERLLDMIPEEENMRGAGSHL